jgi:hypothetical protein
MAIALVSCDKQDDRDKNATLQAQLAGTWIFNSTPIESNFESRITVAANGNYVVHSSNKVQNYDIEGTFRIQMGG